MTVGLVVGMIQDEIWRHAVTTPDRVAVRDGTDELTFAQLEELTGDLAADLAGLGIGRGHVVAVAAGLGINAAVSVFAVLRANAAYLPVDVNSPVSRTELIMANAGVSALIADHDAPAGLRGPRGCRLLAPRPGPPATPWSPAPVDAGDLAYVLSTSGSTGTPKCVMVTHANLDHYLRGADSRYPTAGLGALLHSPLYVDLSVTALFLPLIRGETVTLVLAERGVEAITRQLQREPCGLLKVTPTHLRLLTASLPAGAIGNRVTSLVIGGEALFHADVRRWRIEDPRTRIFNEYGPTEATVAAVCHEVTAGQGEDGPVPMGLPFDGVDLSVIDSRGVPVPSGEVGELVICGPGVARGYLGASAEQAARFGCLSGRPDSYRTGDLVRQWENGQYVYHGRVDDQVKVAGHRIEPAEIESVIRGYGGVAEAAVVPTHDGTRAHRLVAHVVPIDAADDCAGLRDHVARCLPRHMVPSAFEIVSSLPTTANGKVDRAALGGDRPVTGAGPAQSGAAESDLDTALAVIGMDCVFPGADGPAAFWELLRAGRDGLTTLTDGQLAAAGVPRKMTERENYVRVVGVLEDVAAFDADFFGISPVEAQLMDPQHRLLLETVLRALEHAGRSSPADRRSAGLFAGVSANTYFYTQILPHWEELAADREFQLLLGAEKDFVATRAAYELGMQGPAITIQTGCSTALVAVHLAAQSLLAGECDIAIASAACVRVPHQAGLLHREGGVVSPSGRCAAFDVSADGSVPGNGVGAVVLKRLADALRDNDTIYGVVAGSAVNNDGARKAGFAAPSVDGQREVIRTAHLVAGVTPDQVSYVEAHGTATALGDPVECEALSQAFAGSGVVDCAIGSVKTNLGHLDTAAGIAGMIKTVLALHHGELPPSLNFHHLNPAISWQDGWFRVQRELTPWPADRPRIAGVSAFGVGGTNAHVVLHEAPPVPVPVPKPNPGPWCIVLSAPRAEDLPAMAGALADHLEAHPGLALADVAHTLQAGRTAYRCRWGIVVSTRAEVLAGLRATDFARSIRTPPGNLSAGAEDAPVDAHQARSLWLDGHAVRWPGRGRRVALPGMLLRRTRHWVRSPVPADQPSGLAGRSSGVLYAPQWLRVGAPTSSRSPEGGGWLVFANRSPIAEAMLAELRRRGEHVHVVCEGTRFERTGEADWSVGREAGDYLALLRAIDAEPVQHIVHAWQLGREQADPLDLESFDGAVEKGLFSLLSLGKALASGRSHNRCRHLTILTEQQFRVADEHGGTPGRAASLGPALVFPQEIPGLSTALIDIADLAPADAGDGVVRLVLAADRGVFAVRGLRRYRRTLMPVEPDGEGDPNPLCEGRTWLVSGGRGGVGFELAKELAARHSKLVLLDRGSADSDDALLLDVVGEREWLSRLCAELSGQARVPLVHADPELVERLNAMTSAGVLNLLDRLGVATADGERTSVAEIAARARLVPEFRRMLDFLVRCLVADGIVVEDAGRLTFTGVRPEPFADAAESVVAWAPDLADLIEFVVGCVRRLPEVLAGEVTATSVLYPGGSTERMDTAARITMRRSLGLVQTKLIADWLTRLVTRRQGRPLRLLEFGAGNGLLTEQVIDELVRSGMPFEYCVTDIGKTFAAQARRKFGLRAPGVTFTTLDISRDPAEQGFAGGNYDVVFGLNVVHATRDVRETFGQLRKLLVPGGLVALIESVKFERWVDLVAGLAEGWWYFDDSYRSTSPLLDVPTWLTAMRDAGLVDTFAVPGDTVELRRVDCAVLVGRTPASPPDGAVGPQRDTKVAQLEALGAQVEVVRADLREPAQVRAALAAARARWGPFHGFLHCAAEVRGGMVRDLSPGAVEAELGAKVRGALAVLRELRDDPVEMTVFSSSLNVHFGGEGQSAYVAANAALAAIAEHLPGRGVVVDWDRWQDVGLATFFQRTFEGVTGRTIDEGMRSGEAVAAFRAAVATGMSQVAISKDPFDTKYAVYLAAQRGHASFDDPPRAGAEMAPDASEDGLAVELLRLCRDSLGEEQVSMSHRLMDLGADSLAVLYLQADLERTLGVKVFTPALMGQTVEQIAAACRAPQEHPNSVSVVDAMKWAGAVGGAGIGVDR